MADETAVSSTFLRPPKKDPLKADEPAAARDRDAKHAPAPNAHHGRGDKRQEWLPVGVGSHDRHVAGLGGDHVDSAPEENWTLHEQVCGLHHHVYTTW